MHFSRRLRFSVLPIYSLIPPEPAARAGFPVPTRLIGSCRTPRLVQWFFHERRIRRRKGNLFEAVFSAYSGVLEVRAAARDGQARILGGGSRRTARFLFYPRPHGRASGSLDLERQGPFLALLPAGLCRLRYRRTAALRAGPRRGRAVPAQAHQSPALRGHPSAL